MKTSNKPLHGPLCDCPDCVEITNSYKDYPEGKVLEVANQVQSLIMFAALMIDDLPMLKDMHAQSSEISSSVLTLAPVLGAIGADYEEKSVEAEVRRKRAQALTNFIQVLKDTEDDRLEFKKSQAAKAKARAELGGILGL